MKKVFAGAVAGAACWALVHPFDVIKTHVQLAELGTNMTILEVIRNHRSPSFYF